MPVLLGAGKEETVCLVNGHYFQGAMTLLAKPLWYQLPTPGEAKTGCEVLASFILFVGNGPRSSER